MPLLMDLPGFSRALVPAKAAAIDVGGLFCVWFKPSRSAFINLVVLVTVGLFSNVAGIGYSSGSVCKGDASSL